ncbi:VOC family protein [Streptococcus danieliae]|uniref:VOC family protein n=1 Tax=Streptococcus danieliae TaxID=747656 RepID=A0A7Z0M569_9STRE|nr:VOC family protein [Streptococcus danieliae]MBF0698836.1 VOC family protein [Streptococcus danieliae]NYS96013.1 VOC family protein [Streptococcus danieliae]
MYHSQFELGAVALNVRNLALQSLFYQQVLGLEVLAETDQQVDLGVGEQVLIHLLKTEQEGSVAASYGLYHLALVLPSRQDLGTILRHFIDNKIPLQGASDHGYSEAIYLADTEGNGLEIYRDLPQENWDIREDGRIIGITEALDADTIYQLGQSSQQGYRLPLGTRMGHVHLSVKDSESASRFYQEVLALEDKFSIPSAAWLASGNYHHHLAVNEWGGKHLQERSEGLPGLAYYTVVYSQPDHYQATIARARAANLELEQGGPKASFVDVDGIKTLLVLEEKQ